MTWHLTRLITKLFIFDKPVRFNVHKLKLMIFIFKRKLIRKHTKIDSHKNNIILRSMILFSGSERGQHSKNNCIMKSCYFKVLFLNIWVKRHEHLESMWFFQRTSLKKILIHFLKTFTQLFFILGESTGEKRMTYNCNIKWRKLRSSNNIET